MPMKPHLRTNSAIVSPEGEEEKGKAAYYFGLNPYQRFYHYLTFRFKLKPNFFKRLVNSLSNNIIIEWLYGAYFAFSPIFFAAGILIYFSLPFEPSFISIILPTSGLFLSILFLRYYVNWLYAAYLLGIVNLIFAGALAAKFETYRFSTHMLADKWTTTLTGQILEVDQTRSNKVKVKLQIISSENPHIYSLPTYVNLLGKANYNDLKVGSIIKVRAGLTPIKAKQIASGYDFAFHSYFKQIGANGIIYKAPIILSSPADTELANAGLMAKYRFYTAEWRQSLNSKIHKALAGEAGNIAAALIVGQRSGLSLETINNFKLVGLSHLLAISGLHMSLVVGFVLVSLKYLFYVLHLLDSKLPSKQMAAFIAIIIAAFYLILSGAQISTIRSFIMLTTILLGSIIGAGAITLRNLAIAAWLILLFWPHQILEPGFQMSFAASLILVSSFIRFSGNFSAYNKLSNQVTVRKGWVSYLKLFYKTIFNYILKPLFLIGLTSLFAGMASGIYAAYNFQNVALLGVFANMLVMPVVVFIVMPAALLATLCSLIGFEYWPLQLMGLGIEYVIYIAKFMASISPSVLVYPIASLSIIILTIALAILSIFKTRLKLIGAVLLISEFYLMSKAPTPLIVAAENPAYIAIIRPDNTALLSHSLNRATIFKDWQNTYHISKFIPPKVFTLSKAINNKKTRLDLFTPLLEDSDKFICWQSFCSAKLDNGLYITLANNQQSATIACKLGDIVILNYAGFYLACDDPNKLVLSKQALAAAGGVAIYLINGKFKLKSAIDNPARPWNNYRLFSPLYQGR